MITILIFVFLLISLLVLPANAFSGTAEILELIALVISSMEEL